MLLSLKQVEKTLDGKQIIPPMNLEIAGGKIIGLLGPNGSGKTTLLKVISGLAYPTKGQLFFQGDSYVYPQTSWQINYLPDSLIFPQTYTVNQALSFYQSNFDDFSLDKAQQILGDLQIDTKTVLRNMSKGQQERLTLALVLSRRAKLTLLDEPLAAVDVITRDEILYLLKKYIDKDSTIILTTHLIFDMQDLFDEVLFLNRGQIVLYQETKAIKDKNHMNLLSYYRQFFNLDTTHQSDTERGGY